MGLMRAEEEKGQDAIEEGRDPKTSERNEPAGDEQLARELQEAEVAQARQPQVVVVGTPIGVRTQDGVQRWPGQGVAVLVQELSPVEARVLSYRAATMCFAVLDFVSTVMHALTMMNGMYHGLVSLFLVLGPLCGLSGANRFSRPLVAVYLAFCVVKVGVEIALAIVISHWASTLGIMLLFLYLFVALVQMWITKIVMEFWMALGRLSPERRRQLADGGVQGRSAPMVYW